jgi:hypothetical protein
MPVKYETAETVGYMRFSPDGKRLAAAADSDVYVVDANSGKLQEALVAAQTSSPQYHPQYGLWTGVRFLLWDGPRLKLPEISLYDNWAISPNSKLLSIYGSLALRVIDLSNGRVILKLNLKKSCHLARFSADSKKLYMVVDNQIDFIAIPSKKPEKVLSFNDTVYGFALLPDNRQIVLQLCVEKELKKLDLATGVQSGEYSYPNAESMDDLVVSSTGAICAGIATVYLGGSTSVRAVRLIDLDTGRELGLLKSTKGDIRCFCISDDAKQIAAWGEDYQLQIWDFGELIRALSTNEDPILKEAKAAAELRESLFGCSNHGHKLDQIYQLSHALLPAQAQFEYSGKENDVYAILTNPKAKLSRIPLRLRYGRKLLDVLNMDPGLMVHERVIDLFKSKGFKGWEAVPISPAFKRDQKPDGRYFGLKLNSTCGPIVKRAQEGMGDFRPIVDLKKWDGNDLFRPDDYAFYLATERVVRAMADAGITGWKAERVTWLP